MEQNHDGKPEKSIAKTILIILLKLVITALALLVILYGGSILVLLLATEDIYFHLTLIGGYLLPLLFLPVIWLKKRKTYFKIWLIPAILYTVIVGANFGILKYHESITVDTTAYVDIYEYLPFEEGTKVVKVEDASLDLSGDLPQLSGNEATFSIYASVIYALYPQIDDEGFNDHLGYSKAYHYENVAEESTGILFIDRYPTEEELQYAEEYECTFAYTPIGNDGFVFFVHKDNPIDNLTTDQIKGIYAGEITNWSEVGGKSKKIDAYQNEEDSDIQAVMERFMGDKALMKPPTAMGYGNYYEWEEQVTIYRNKKNSIGFAPRFCVQNNPDVKILSIDGVAPTNENIKNGTYPNTIPLLVVRDVENTNKNIDKIIDWILTDEGQYIVEECGYVGLPAKNAQ